MGNGGVLVARTEKEISDINDLVVEDFSTGEWIKYSVAMR